MISAYVLRGGESSGTLLRARDRPLTGRNEDLGLHGCEAPCPGFACVWGEISLTKFEFCACLYEKSFLSRILLKWHVLNKRPALIYLFCAEST